MAKFHGFEIKNMKTFMGMEGYGTQGDVWLNGKKLGFWCNDGNGGEDRFEFPRNVVNMLNELCADQCSECAIDSYGMPIDADLSLVLAHLCDLKDIEKEWKRVNKKGCSLVALRSNETDESVIYQIGSTDRRGIMRWLVANAGAEMKKHDLGDGSFDIYDSAESFIIGQPLVGAESAITKCIEWQNERDKIVARFAQSNQGVA